MCGIAGILGPGGSDSREDALAEMVASLAHRGPDGSGLFVEEGIALAHRRLSIIDLAEGAQPMHCAEGRCVVTFNGEIFNYIELRAELRKLGSTFRTNSDTEILLEGYKAWGTALLPRLNGQFAFALYDRVSKSTLLARDRFGEKPLFISREPYGLAFASEVKAILTLRRRMGAPVRLWRERLWDYLSLNYVPAGDTLISGIHSLPPGTFALLTADREERRGFVDELPPLSSPDVPLEQLERCIRHSAKIRLRSDVPVGIFLSGGLDSTTIAWAAAEEQANVTGFVADFDTDTFSEAAAAAEVGQKLGFHVERIGIHPARENLPDLVQSLVFHGDTPLADSSALPVYLLSRETAKSVKVVLSGDGGDELFGGYLTYRATEYARRLGVPGRAILASASPLSQLLPISSRKVSLGEKLERFLRGLALSPGAAHFAWNGMLGSAAKLSLLNREFIRSLAPDEAPTDTFAQLAARFHLSPNQPTLGSLMKADQEGYLVDDILVKVDRMTMAHGLEARPVLLDPSILELSRGLSDQLHGNTRSGKLLLKALLRRHLPWYDLSRPKQGFSIPIHQWFRTDLKPLFEDVLADSPHAKEIFNTSELTRLWQQHLERKRNVGFELWGILILLLWLRRFSVDL